MLKKKVSGTEFENYVYSTIRKNFPAHDGFWVEEQPTIRGGYRPDFAVGKRRVHAVVDAKDKEILQPKDIDQILKYQSKTKASEARIYIANDTEIPESVKDLADALDVKIRRTQWRA